MKCEYILKKQLSCLDGLDWDNELPVMKIQGNEFLKADSDNDKFLTRQAGMYAHPDDFVVRWKPLSMNICETEVTLTAYGSSSDTITKRLDQVFGNDQTVSVMQLYTVMK